MAHYSTTHIASHNTLRTHHHQHLLLPSLYQAVLYCAHITSLKYTPHSTHTSLYSAFHTSSVSHHLYKCIANANQHFGCSTHTNHKTPPITTLLALQNHTLITFTMPYVSAHSSHIECGRRPRHAMPLQVLSDFEHCWQAITAHYLVSR